MSDDKNVPVGTQVKGTTMTGNSTGSGQQGEKETTLKLDDILLDDEYRIREKEDEATIAKYAELYRDNEAALKCKEKPPHQMTLIVVWLDPNRGQYVLLGGFHRLEAARRAGLVEIRVSVVYGSPDEAFAVALKDNAKHGRPMSDGDKKYAIIKAFRRYDGAKGIREIAREVGCSASYASKINGELSGKKSSATPKDTDKQPEADTPRKSDSKPTPDQAKSLDEIIAESITYYSDRLQMLSDAEERHAYHTRIIGWLVKNHEKSRSTVSGL